MPTKKSWFPALVLAALFLALPQAAAGHPPDLLLLEQEIFLGETLLSSPLEKTLAQALYTDPQYLECRWVTPQGPVPLKELAKEMPQQNSEYLFSAMLSEENGDHWVHGLCRVTVVSGTITVTAPAGALVCLKGEHFTLYQLAEAGTPACRFQELPFGLYTVSLVGGQEPPQQLYLGVCPENDTVSTQRCRASASFQGAGAAQGTPGGRWLCGRAPSAGAGGTG